MVEMNITNLPPDILVLIASFLPLDIQIIKMFRVINLPAYYLPELKNNYNFFLEDNNIANNLLRRGFKLSITTNYKSLGMLSAKKQYLSQIKKLKIYISPNTRILSPHLIGNFTHLRELILPDNKIELDVIKRLSATLEKYYYYDRYEPDSNQYKLINFYDRKLMIKNTRLNNFI